MTACGNTGPIPKILMCTSIVKGYHNDWQIPPYNLAYRSLLRGLMEQKLQSWTGKSISSPETLQVELHWYHGIDSLILINAPAVAQFMHVLRQRIQLGATESIFLMVNGVAPTTGYVEFYIQFFSSVTSHSLQLQYVSNISTTQRWWWFPVHGLQWREQHGLRNASLHFAILLTRNSSARPPSWNRFVFHIHCVAHVIVICFMTLFLTTVLVNVVVNAVEYIHNQVVTWELKLHSIMHKGQTCLTPQYAADRRRDGCFLFLTLELDV